MAETNHIVTKGTASGSSEARVCRTEFSQSFQETGFVCKTHDDHNNDDRKASRRLTESSHASGPPQSQAAPWQGHLGPSRLWSAFKVLVPGGKEVVGEDPFQGWGGEVGWVTEPAGSGSSRSLRTGPRCYCSCGGPWSRTQRARRATPAPGRWDR